MRCRPGIVKNAESGTVPDQRRIVSRYALTLHRIRDTSRYFLTQITRVTEAFAASTPAVPEDGAT